MVKLGVAYSKGQTIVKILEQTDMSEDDDYLGHYIQDSWIFYKAGEISMEEIARNFSREYRVKTLVKKFRLARNGFDFLESSPYKKRKKRFKQLKFNFS